MWEKLYVCRIPYLASEPLAIEDEVERLAGAVDGDAVPGAVVDQRAVEHFSKPIFFIVRETELGGICFHLGMVSSVLENHPRFQTRCSIPPLIPTPR